eukprot:scaffold4595_cov415-Prasinococcus_capsulatus_cf.AAC.14
MGATGTCSPLPGRGRAAPCSRGPPLFRSRGISPRLGPDHGRPQSGWMKSQADTRIPRWNLPAGSVRPTAAGPAVAGDRGPPVRVRAQSRRPPATNYIITYTVSTTGRGGWGGQSCGPSQAGVPSTGTQMPPCQCARLQHPPRSAGGGASPAEEEEEEGASRGRAPVPRPTRAGR